MFEPYIACNRFFCQISFWHDCERVETLAVLRGRWKGWENHVVMVLNEIKTSFNAARCKSGNKGGHS